MTVPAEVVLASTRPDADAVEAVRRHHAELAAGLAARVEAVMGAAEAADRVATARDDLVAFCRGELLPHAQAEESVLYRAAAELPDLRALVGVLGSEHTAIQALVDEVAGATSGVRAAAGARALAALFRPHLAAENDVVLPRLAAEADVSLSDLVRDMHEDFVDRQAGPGPAGPGPAELASHPGCGCGGTDEESPVLDVRTIPHAIRHASVFGAFDAIPAGGSLVLVAPHDPLPLLRQLSERAGGRLEVTYLERGPDAWRLALTR